MSPCPGSTPPSLPRGFSWGIPATCLCPAPPWWRAGSQAADTSTPFPSLPHRPATRLLPSSALQLLTVLKFGFSSAGPVSYAVFFSLFVSVSLSSPSLPPATPRGLLLLSPPLVGCPPRPPGREGRMVVLSLVLGLSEQDDFANIPDLQNPGTQQNQNAQGDKRYEHRRGPAAAVAEKEAWRGCQPRPPAAGRGSGTFCGCWSGRTTPPQPAPSHRPCWWCPLGLRPVWLSWDHSGSSLLPGPACPRPEQASISAPSSCLAPLCCPLIFHFCPTQPRNPSFSGGWWAAGMLGRGRQPVFPHPRHLNLPFAWRSPWGDGHTHTHTPPLQRCDRLLRADGRGGPGREGLGPKKGPGIRKNQKGSPP